MKKFAILAAAVFFTGCASAPTKTTPDTAIADAEAAAKKAGSVGGEWRDTGKMIEGAKKALAAGETDKAAKLAVKAKKEAELGFEQATAQKNAGPWLF